MKVSQPTISNYETGKRKQNYEIVCRIAQATGKPIPWFYDSQAEWRETMGSLHQALTDGAGADLGAMVAEPRGEYNARDETALRSALERVEKMESELANLRKTLEGLL